MLPILKNCEQKREGLLVFSLLTKAKARLKKNIILSQLPA